MISAEETKVPARGKAMIPTELSIAIPPGTYVRIGNFLSLSLSHFTENWKINEEVRLHIQMQNLIIIHELNFRMTAPRSGLAWKHSIDVGAGVIDADYRGPVGVILFNHSDVDFEVKAGDRIAQLIIEKIVTPEVEEVDDLDATERGSGGFGSTGV